MALVPQIFLAMVTVASLLLSCSFSTSSASTTDPFLQQGLDRVGKLPGQTFNISFAHYAGYVAVNDTAGRALFYWFFEADEDPHTKPLVLWLNGVANILFLESPAGVGFSYSNTSSDILNSGDKRTAEDSLIFLLNWFERFPQYQGREFFITGESYAGHYIPQLSQVIVKYNSATKKNAINLIGYMVGNALTDDYHDFLGVAQFMWSIGLISDQTYKLLNLHCDFDSFLHPSDSCDEIFYIADKELGNIDPYSIFTDLCTANVSQSNQLLRRKRRIGRLNEGYDPCTKNHSTIYFNLPEVQKALHVDPDHRPAKWDTCSEEVNKHWKDSPRTVLDVYDELIHLGLRIWIFSGDTDAIIPVTSTRYSINALKLPTVRPWRPWYDGGQVGGWTQEYSGLTFVAVRGAGHEVPLHRPKLALALIKAFLAGTSVPTLELLSDS